MQESSTMPPKIKRWAQCNPSPSFLHILIRILSINSPGVIRKSLTEEEGFTFHSKAQICDHFWLFLDCKFHLVGLGIENALPLYTRVTITIAELVAEGVWVNPTLGLRNEWIWNLIWLSTGTPWGGIHSAAWNVGRMLLICVRMSAIKCQ